MAPDGLIFLISSLMKTALLKLTEEVLQWHFDLLPIAGAHRLNTFLVFRV